VSTLSRRSCALLVVVLSACSDDSGPRPASDSGAAPDGAVDSGAPADSAIDGVSDVPAAGLDAADVAVACESSCPGPCQSCDLPGAKGRCQPRPAGTICLPAFCQSDTHFVVASTCDGAGACVAGIAIGCAPTRCRDNKCLGSCRDDGDCQAPTSCRSGNCLGGGAFGCTRNQECQSGFCVQGVCCDRACTSSCETCALPSSRGTCRPLPPESRPDAGCGDLAPGP